MLFDGIIHVTGEPDTGKTTFAIESGSVPEKIDFFDDDIKGESINRSLNFGGYHNLVELGRNKDEIAFHEAVIKLINEIPDNRFDTIVFDGFSRFENTFHPYVVKNPSKFRTNWSPNGAIKGAQMWQTAFEYEADVLNRLQSKANLVIITTHLKQYTVNGVRVEGKFVPDCKKPLIQKAQLRLWLRHNPDGSPYPIGLVLKRIAKRTVVPGKGIRTVSVLPRKVTPCTWDKINEYWDNPIGDREPVENEIPNPFELSLIDGHLTEDQKDMFKFGARLAEVKANDDLVGEIQTLIENGIESVPMITRSLKEAGFDVDLNKVKSIMNTMRGGNDD